MKTSCSECTKDVEETEVEQCSECDADGLCNDCLLDHDCDGDEDTCPVCGDFIDECTCGEDCLDEEDEEDLDDDGEDFEF